MTQFLVRFSSWLDVLPFSLEFADNFRIHCSILIMAIDPGSDVVKQAQTMILPPPCFTDGIKFLMSECSVFLSSNTRKKCD